MVRKHTVTVSGGGVTRVMCDYCESQHNYRGGERAAAPRKAGAPPRTASPGPIPLVSERERSSPPMSHDPTSGVDLERMLRRVIREETGLTPTAPAARWHDGELVLRPGRGDLQEKSWPIETFFHKIVMIRNRLRTMEQQINASDLPAAQKVKLQGYLTACYGSLTSFNILFAEEDDRFRGSSSS